MTSNSLWPPGGTTLAFESIGAAAGKIPVRLGYRIVELFSEGLYASPNKAIEELVSNSFDAGAENVHVFLSPDRTKPDAIIAVVDDGTSMDAEGLRNHWRIGVSDKRQAGGIGPRGRRVIGKFGIGKLATFVLGARFTHICKTGGQYFATTMDYSRVEDKGGELAAEDAILELPLRELSEADATVAIPAFIRSGIESNGDFKLFGPESRPTWTIAIISALKDMARELQKGRLAWVLGNGMPLREDFRLFLDGQRLLRTKLKEAPRKTWILGKDIKGTDLPKPCPGDLVSDTQKDLPSPLKHGLVHPLLGRITGRVEIYDDNLTALSEADQSLTFRKNGFFVFVHGRLVNITDERFGLDPDKLRHGTFARFRMIVEIDSLDAELRSTREAVRDVSRTTYARNLLHASFNFARTWMEKDDRTRQPGETVKNKVANSPYSLARRPLVGLAQLAVSGKAKPLYSELPPGLTSEAGNTLVDNLKKAAEVATPFLDNVSTDDIGVERPLGVFNLSSRSLRLNTLHPFTAAHRDNQTILDLLALSTMVDVLTEAHLYNLGVATHEVEAILSIREELFRSFSKKLPRTSHVVAQALLDAQNDPNSLEEELIACFNSMGFDAVRIGGNGKPDGKAEARLAARDGAERRYSLTLESKSKANSGAKASANQVGVSRIARHRKDYDADHAVVLAPDFHASTADAAVLQEMEQDRKLTGKTISLIRTNDLARLVRLVPIKAVGLDRLRGLFSSCFSPDEVKEWIDKLEAEVPQKPPYKEILAIVWELQQTLPDLAVEFATVVTQLKLLHNLHLKKDELVDLCKAMSRMAPQVVVREQTVELTQPPDRILDAVSKTLSSYPVAEQKLTVFEL